MKTIVIKNIQRSLRAFFIANFPSLNWVFDDKIDGNDAVKLITDLGYREDGFHLGADFFQLSVYSKTSALDAAASLAGCFDAKIGTRRINILNYSEGTEEQLATLTIRKVDKAFLGRAGDYEVYAITIYYSLVEEG